MGILSDYETGIPLLQNWLQKQVHLPQLIDKTLLERYIHTCNGDLERAKKLIDLNYTMRNNHSHIFLKRDPCDDASQQVLETTDMLILPNTTPDGNKVLFYRLINLDPDKFNFTEAIKMFFMMADVRFVTADSSGTGDGEVPIFDMAGFSLRHLTRVVLSSLRVYMKFTQEAHPIKLKSIHVINCPSYLDKVLTVVKPFIKSEVFKMIQFHLPASDTLYKTVPKDMLPNELGGKAGDVASIKSKWIEVLKQKRDYLMDERYWKINDLKREKIKGKGNMEVNGSFRALSID